MRNQFYSTKYFHSCVAVSSAVTSRCNKLDISQNSKITKRNLQILDANTTSQQHWKYQCRKILWLRHYQSSSKIFSNELNHKTFYAVILSLAYRVADLRSFPRVERMVCWYDVSWTFSHIVLRLKPVIIRPRCR